MECTDGEYHSEEGKESWCMVGKNDKKLLDVGRGAWTDGPQFRGLSDVRIRQNYLVGCLSSVGEEEASNLLKTPPPIPRILLSLATVRT